MALGFTMRNGIHGQLISNGYVMCGQCVCDDSINTWLMNGNACKMFAKMLDRDLV